MFAIFYLAQPFSQMIGAPLSGGLISVGDQVTPFHGWQAMFAGEGILAVLAGIAALVFLTNSPQQAKWLEPGEKASLTAAMEREDTARSEDGPKGIWRAMASGRVWYFTIIYFCLQVAVYGTTFYLPQQVSSLLGQDVGWQVGLVSAIPWLVGLVACYLIGSRADSVGRRRRWGTLFYVTTGLSILGSAWAGANGQPVLGILFITLAVASFLAVGPITWAYPTAFLTGAAAADHEITNLELQGQCAHQAGVKIGKGGLLSGIAHAQIQNGVAQFVQGVYNVTVARACGNFVYDCNTHSSVRSFQIINTIFAILYV
jgi:sugar phosphate permease